MWLSGTFSRCAGSATISGAHLVSAVCAALVVARYSVVASLTHPIPGRIRERAVVDTATVVIVLDDVGTGRYVGCGASVST